MSMIDDTEMEAAFEKSPLPREKWWLFGFFLPDSAPLCLSVGHVHLHYIAECSLKYCCYHIETQTINANPRSPIICNFITNICRVKCKSLNTPRAHQKLWSLSWPRSISTCVSDRKVTIIWRYITATVAYAAGANKVTWPFPLQALPFSPF